MTATYASYRPAAAAALGAALDLDTNAARREVDHLARAVLAPDRDLQAHADTTPLSQAQRERLDTLLAARACGQPLAHVLGDAEFFGLRLRCTPDTLVPRPETELLAEFALASLPAASDATVADFGCGGGAIAAALATARPHVRVLAVEASAAAAKVAQANFTSLDLANQVKLIVAPWHTVTAQVDMLVCNPPYVTSGMCTQLRAQGLLHDPRAALDGGADGLDAYREVIALASGGLGPCADIMFEHGVGQHHAIAGLAADSGWTVADMRRDMQGLKRLLHLRRDA